MQPEPKKKKDIEALSSHWMKMPSMRVDIARDLLDLGFREWFEIEGRSGDALYEDLKRLRGKELPIEKCAYFRMAIYFAETGYEGDRDYWSPRAWE